jgi:hypothetical protein
MAMLCAWVIGCATTGQAQTHKDTIITHLLRIYEDDDFINIWGEGTDNAYTNGTRIDYFYQRPQPSHSILDKWMPGAGDSTTDIYSWGAFQIMYTPDDITNPAYQPNDYPWSGALVASHARYSYNPKKHYDIQTELVMGVLGPAAEDQLTQTMVHRMIHYLKPAGWDRQYRNDLLLNVNLTAEKQLVAWGSALRILGAGQLYGGTMQNGAAIYPVILLGKMDPYFNGFISQYTSRTHGRKHWQAYFVAKPEMQLFLTNAVLQGGLFTTNPNLQTPTGPSKEIARQPYHPLQNWVGSLAFGGVVTYGGVGLSFTQTTSAATLKGLYCHSWGNISLYFGW